MIKFLTGRIDTRIPSQSTRRYYQGASNHGFTILGCRGHASYPQNTQLHRLAHCPESWPMQWSTRGPLGVGLPARSGQLLQASMERQHGLLNI